MIGPHDRIRLPDGVELRDGSLHDVVRVGSIPVNATGLAVLAAATPRDAAAALARHHGVDPETAFADAVRFCTALNVRFLLNIAPRGGRAAVAWRWLRSAPLLLPLGVAPTLPTTRRSVDTARLRSLACTAPAALAPFVASLLAAGTVVAVLVLGALGVAAPAVAVVIGATIAGSIALHELGHLAALRGVPACVVTRGVRVVVVHREICRRRTIAVAASGPAAGLAAGACLAAAVHAWPSTELGTAVLVASVNALGLTVLSRDGRTLCGLR